MPLNDAAVIRAHGIARWTSTPAPGDWWFNTHHHHYQARLASGIFRVFTPDLIEMNDAQFERWLSHVREVREAARRTLAEHMLAQEVSHA